MDPLHTASPSRPQLQVPRYTPSISPSFTRTPQTRSGRFGGTPDTPMGAYSLRRPSVRQGFYRKDTTQVPLSALCPTRAEPGSVGRPFCSTTKVKCVPLPTLFSRHYLTPHTLRKVSVHTRRYTPALPTPNPPLSTVSYSTLNFPKAGLSTQRQHLAEREGGVRNSKSLQRAREVTPHRLTWAFYMTGEPVQIFDRQEMSPEELRMLQQLTLSLNPALFYGSGAKVASSQTPKQLARFQSKLKQAVSDAAGLYGGYEGFRGFGEQALDVGRYSRMSRTMTPGSPILELEEDTPPPSPLPPVEEDTPPSLPPTTETFLTDQHHNS